MSKHSREVIPLSMPDPAHSALPYDARDVVRWFGSGEVTKAQAYLDQISALEIRPDKISARVRGSAARPYPVLIRFVNQGVKGARPIYQCACPVGGHCKHVAAVLLRALADGQHSDRVDPSVLTWVEELREVTSAPRDAARQRAPQARQRLFYVLQTGHGPAACSIGFLKGRSDVNGHASVSVDGWSNVERALTNPPQFVSEEDAPILRLLWAQRSREYGLPAFMLAGSNGHDMLTRMLATGRLLADGAGRMPLKAGEPRPAKIEWSLDAQGRLRAGVTTEPASSSVIAVDPPWYLDANSHEIGLLVLKTPAPVLLKLLSLPPLSARESELVAAALAELAPEVPAPNIDAIAKVRLIDAALVPTLSLRTVTIRGLVRYREYRGFFGETAFDLAVPSFGYGELSVSPDDSREFFQSASGELVRVTRQRERETELLESLAGYGLARIPAQSIYHAGDVPQSSLALASEAAWPVFVGQQVPQLRAAGWKVAFAPGFRYNLLVVERWEADISEGEGGWFDVDMGIVVEGARRPLAPLLAGLLKGDPRWLDGVRLAAIDDDEAIDLLTDDERRIRVPAGRLKPLVATLIDLFETLAHKPLGPLRLSRFDAPRLAELGTLTSWQFTGMQAVNQMAQSLYATAEVSAAGQPALLPDGTAAGPIEAAIEPPAGLTLPLRPYQLAGLAWLQFLRKHDLAGILADDMGLGKTAQALAHILLEKEQGRLDRPVLVVLPTSLVFNWKHEAARWTPALKVLSLLGIARKSAFASIPDYDLVLTTYPLLWRDIESLREHPYHLLILDEAQMVKNSQTRAAAAARQLTARHRLCITGTPLENHLGELWSQFDFLLPGFLGDARTFNRVWRTPIEKHGDALRSQRLRARIRPFLLRRRKDDVARELPPKTEIIRSVELGGGQRDLYETVRSAMDARVREVIAQQGLARSSIVILDALLKLRQVCCDPRLVKSPAAARVRERAKLDLLMDMLPALVEEGRRILVFSQFTEMLALIEIELEQSGLTWVKLTGSTRDRETPVRRFQQQEVPIFLISLKAGGVGLNLTAADVVIHFDPWWNPAVEDQATDRAHRIGQDKAVFVYKLVVAGSIEERILGLQARKAQLVSGVLSDDRVADPKFDAQDLAAMLEPLPSADLVAV